MMFSSVLIANRGEIAVRIAQTLQQMGIRAVAVYSEPDRRAVHVARADEAHALGGNTSAESYLRIEKIIDAARRCGADAIHPGYGFLSENADFAQACADAGIAFIGPTPAVIRAMGDKVTAKRLMAEAGVPVVPGAESDVTRAGAAEQRDCGTGFQPVRDTGYKPVPQDSVVASNQVAAAIGYPVLVKAAAGGGGKGMRVVRGESELQPAIEAAEREAAAAFGDARVFLEKFIERPCHVEFQIFGDDHGNVVHLFERECSIQRRHQKIIEESPSPFLTDELRCEMAGAAVRAAKAIGYTNAGTIEFMVDPAGRFYFLEVNTRLQVEHPVTEMTLRQDLVRAQILVAASERLPFDQAALQPAGHAIECRIYAEDASRGFLPSTGVVEQYEPPAGPNIRVDSGVVRGSEVTVHYDPMLAKLLVWSRTREEAIRRMCWALRNFVILGVTTNIEFLHDVITHPAFVAGEVHTQFLDENPIGASSAAAEVPDEALIAAALTAQQTPGAGARGMTGPLRDQALGPWHSAGHWRAF